MTSNHSPRVSRLVNGRGKKLSVSFEFFPPKTEEMERTLWDAIERLAPLSAAFRLGHLWRRRLHARAHACDRQAHAERDRSDAGGASHLRRCHARRGRCGGAQLSRHRRAHIVALRGDPAGGVGSAYVPHPGGYENAADLVAGIRRIGDFEVSVSAYPEKHPDSRHANVDLDMLQAKVDAGATRAITQFFFENDVYFRYLDRVRSRGIDIPIVPGIVPVQNFKQVKNFAERCGTFIPNWLAERFDGLDDDVATRKLVAAAVAAEQVLDLVDRGVTDFHFYTMNRADLVYAICHLLGLRPAEKEAA